MLRSSDPVAMMDRSGCPRKGASCFFSSLQSKCFCIARGDLSGQCPLFLGLQVANEPNGEPCQHNESRCFIQKRAAFIGIVDLGGSKKDFPFTGDGCR